MRDYYKEVLDILGSTGVIIPVGDAREENAARTTVTTRGSGGSFVFTYSEAITALDNRLYRKGKAGLFQPFNHQTVDERADSPDATYWSRGDSLADSAFSVGAWVRLYSTPDDMTIMSKIGTTTAKREWFFWLQRVNASSAKLFLRLFDESVPVSPDIVSSVTVGLTELAFIVATYDGTGGANAMVGAELYKNGVIDAAPVRTENASYVAMENGTALMHIVANRNTADALDQFLRADLGGGPLGPFFTQIELTQANVSNLYRIGLDALDRKAAPMFPPFMVGV